MGEDTEGPHVGGRPDAAAAFADLGPQQFGRCVVRGGEGGRVGVGALQFGGHVEVGQPHRTVRHQQDVGRFQVTVHPARPVQLSQPGADLGEQRGPVRRAGRGGDQGGEGALRPLQDEDGGAVQPGVAGVVDGEGLVHPDQPGLPQPAQQRDLALDQVPQVGELPRGAGTGGQELQGGRVRQVPAARVAAPGACGAVDAARGVDAAEGAGGDRLAHLPPAHPVAPGHRDGVRLGHRGAFADGAARTARSSSRTRSKRSARETSDSFLPFSRGPGSAVSGPGFSRSFTAR